MNLSAIILKHQESGSATAENVVKAHDRAFACDPISAFGGIIGRQRGSPGVC